MKLNNEPLKNWFGFTRRERRSSSILLIIIIFIIGSRYLLPEKNIEIENYGIFLSDTEIAEMISDDDISTGNMSFPLNQAPASNDTLKNPVFGERKSHSTITYSSSGRKLRNPSGMQQQTPIDINGCDSAALSLYRE